jgi:1-aminocyclopropane-1-carboxylate deaminase
MFFSAEHIVDVTKARLQKLNHPICAQHNVATDVLRLDEIHTVISGNKWFKLKYHLTEAISKNKKGILTFGGAWSNHLHATAYLCKECSLESIGIIRGEEPKQLSQTLIDLKELGMQLRFTSRNEYAVLTSNEQYEEPGYHVVPEGGRSLNGVKGAAEIADLIPPNEYDYIMCSAGTATMMAGLAKASLPGQKVIGISILKMANQENNDLINLVRKYDTGNAAQIIYDYHFGGYGKSSPELIEFMNRLFIEHDLPTDLVYTSKLLFGTLDLIGKNFFPQGSNICIIHSGGLQGNRSIPPGVLKY